MLALTRWASAAPPLCLIGLGLRVAALFRAMLDAARGDVKARTPVVGLVLLPATLICDVLSELRLVRPVEGTPVPGFTVLFLSATHTANAALDDSIRSADQALYQTKQQGRNRVVAAG